jgi:predicted nuclease of predicted toxin-antitoxin system
MRFLVDECTGPVVARWLRDQSHEVFSVYEEARGTSDEDVLAKAYAESRILITNDKDFGEMVFRERKLLESYADQLPGAFVVVTETRIRFGTT